MHDSQRSLGPHLRVFLAYSHADLELKKRLEQKLAAVHVDVLSDSYVEIADDHWARKLEELIGKSDCICFIWSSVTHRSHWVRDELEIAEYLALPTLFLLIDDAKLPANAKGKVRELRTSIRRLDEEINDITTCLKEIGHANKRDAAQRPCKWEFGITDTKVSVEEIVSKESAKILKFAPPYLRSSAWPKRIVRKVAWDAIDGSERAREVANYQGSALYFMAKLCGYLKTTLKDDSSEGVYELIAFASLWTTDIAGTQDIVYKGLTAHPSSLKLRYIRAVLKEREGDVATAKRFALDLVRNIKAEARLSDELIILKVDIVRFLAHLAGSDFETAERWMQEAIEDAKKIICDDERKDKMSAVYLDLSSLMTRKRDIKAAKRFLSYAKRLRKAEKRRIEKDGV